MIASSTSGLLPSRAPGRGRSPRAAWWSAIRSTPSTCCRWWRWSAGVDLARHGRAGERRSTRPSGCARSPLPKEIDGFVADRLLEALWREALWLVHDGVATVEQIDDAIRFGAGLRWSFMGTFLTYRLAGGEAGMRHFMEQFGPTLAWPWTKLVDVPELTDELIDRLVGAVGRPGRGPLDPRARGAARRQPGGRPERAPGRRCRCRRGARPLRAAPSRAGRDRPRRQRWIPASRSHVVALTPRSRSLTFSTFSVGVRGSSSTRST